MILVGSDGNSLAPYGITGQGKPHPRFYGTFVRVLGHYVRDLGLMPLHTAVHKMTGGSAAALRLVDRGTLREGNWADVTVFDPDTVAEVATYDDPHQYATGISTVVVNGEVVIDEAEHTGGSAREGVAEGRQWRWLALGAAFSTGGLSEKALILIRPGAIFRVTPASPFQAKLDVRLYLQSGQYPRVMPPQLDFHGQAHLGTIGAVARTSGPVVT